MIICDRCKCEIEKELIECAEVDIVTQDQTEIKPEGNVFRYCMPCWKEMGLFLLSEGM